VLDNVEHLGPAHFTRLLHECPGLTILATSRERLDVAAEWLLPRDGLQRPGEEVAPCDAVAADAVALFIEGARQVVPAFEPDAEEVAAIVALCGLVEGSPLAIELAAPWTLVMPCAEIIAELERSVDILARTSTGAAERQRSMRATFESSWSRLNAIERRALTRLSFFAGGFRRDSAAAVAGASIALLAALLDKSVVRVGADRRFDLHPLFRQFVREKLAEQPMEEEAAREATVAGSSASPATARRGSGCGAAARCSRW
jgi:predicted ATPase